jgi:drug/metabolite transporter (DMT)-like permease
LGLDGKYRNLVTDTQNARARELSGIAMVAGAAALWGTFSLFFRNAERITAEAGGTLSPATESFVFFGVVLVLLGPTSLMKKPQKKPTREAWIWLAFFSIADAVNVLFYFAAMQKTTVAIAVLTHYLAPVFLALLAPRLLKEPRSAGTWTSVAVALVGLALLLEPHRDHAGASWTGALLGTGSAILFAGAMMSVKRLGEWFSSAQVLTLHYPGALLVLYYFIPSGELMSLGKEAWGLLVLCGVLPGTIAGLLFVEGFRRLPASRAGVLTLIEPVVAVLVGLVIWNETPGPIAFLGGAIVLGAAYRVIRAGSTAEGAAGAKAAE